MNDTSVFDLKAKDWDDNPRRRELAEAVAAAIRSTAAPRPDMAALEYGCGTGLLGMLLLPELKELTFADNSPGMLETLRGKLAAANVANAKAIHCDLLVDHLEPESFDLLFSQMVMHHIADTAAILTAFHSVLRPGGVLCLADLDAEPGDFHAPDNPVPHHGFNRAALASQARTAGFVDLGFTAAHAIEKPTADGQLKTFPVFLLVGRKK